MHLGHADAALFARSEARRTNKRFLLRIEDIDRDSCHPQFEAAILEDLGWLDLEREPEVRRQSDHMRDYSAALAHLDELGVVYLCFCM